MIVLAYVLSHYIVINFKLPSFNPHIILKWAATIAYTYLLKCTLGTYVYVPVFRDGAKKGR